MKVSVRVVGLHPDQITSLSDTGRLPEGTFHTANHRFTPENKMSCAEDVCREGRLPLGRRLGGGGSLWQRGTPLSGIWGDIWGVTGVDQAQSDWAQ